MSGHQDEIADAESPGKQGSPAKKGQQAESFYMTSEKVLDYASDIIKQIKMRMEQLDDPNATPLDFGIE